MATVRKLTYDTSVELLRRSEAVAALGFSPEDGSIGGRYVASTTDLITWALRKHSVVPAKGESPVDAFDQWLRRTREETLPEGTPPPRGGSARPSSTSRGSSAAHHFDLSKAQIDNTSSETGRSGVSENRACSEFRERNGDTPKAGSGGIGGTNSPTMRCPRPSGCYPLGGIVKTCELERAEQFLREKGPIAARDCPDDIYEACLVLVRQGKAKLVDRWEGFVNRLYLKAVDNGDIR